MTKDEKITKQLKSGKLWGTPDEFWHKGVDFSARSFHMLDFIFQYIPGYRYFHRHAVAFGYARGLQDAYAESIKKDEVKTDGTI